MAKGAWFAKNSSASTVWRGGRLAPRGSSTLIRPTSLPCGLRSGTSSKSCGVQLVEELLGVLPGALSGSAWADGDGSAPVDPADAGFNSGKSPLRQFSCSSPGRKYE